MKSLLKLFLLTGMLTSLSGTFGMQTEKIQNEGKKPAQDVLNDSFVNEEEEYQKEYSEEEKLWGLDKIRQFVDRVRVGVFLIKMYLPPEMWDFQENLKCWLQNDPDHKKLAVNLFDDLKDKFDTNITNFNMFLSYLISKHILSVHETAEGTNYIVLEHEYIDEDHLASQDDNLQDDDLNEYDVSDYEILKQKIHACFKAFSSLKDIYLDLFVNSNQNINDPFVIWVKQDSTVIPNILSFLMRGDPKSAWLNFCNLHSQYSVGWPAPKQQPAPEQRPAPEQQSSSEDSE